MSTLSGHTDLSSDNENPPLRTSSATVIDLTIRLGILAALAYWSLLLVRPFLAIALWSIVLTVALFPMFEWLAARLGGHRGVAAVLITILNLLIVLGPVTWLGVGLIETLRSASERLIAGTLSIPPAFESVKDWPIIGERVYDIWNLASTNLGAALTKVAPQLKPLGGSLLGMAAEAGAGLFKFLAAVIICGFLFLPSQSLLGTIRSLSTRIDTKRGEIFVQLAGATIRNISRGVIGISLLQALLAGIGLMVAGVPNAGLITFAVLLLGIIQIGPTLILVPVIAWYWFVMDTMTALVFTAYMLPVNLLDNVLRPIVLARGMATPMPVIFLGIVGGTLAHGIIGVFVGPIVLAVAWELLVAWARVDQVVSTAESIGTDAH
jgi:predicted PurR-regulated permease PerM